MKPVREVTDRDIAAAFYEATPRQVQRQQRKQAMQDARLKMLEEFKTCWQEHLAYLVCIPDDEQILLWLRIAKYDWPILSATIENLRARAKHPFDPGDGYSHALGFFSAALIRRMKAKFGPPPERQVAA
jgi:hypothetical protein